MKEHPRPSTSSTWGRRLRKHHAMKRYVANDTNRVAYTTSVETPEASARAVHMELRKSARPTPQRTSKGLSFGSPADEAAGLDGSDIASPLYDISICCIVPGLLVPCPPE